MSELSSLRFLPPKKAMFGSGVGSLFALEGNMIKGNKGLENYMILLVLNWIIMM